MGKTHKLEKARALHHYDQPHKDVKLIPRGMPEGLRNTKTGKTHEYHVDNGGQRYGNQRKMRAKMKVDARKSERMKNKKIDLE